MHSSGGGATKARPAAAASRGQALAQPQIGGDPAGGDEAPALGMVAAKPGERVRGAVDQRVADRQLDDGGEVGDVLRPERARPRAMSAAT